MEQKRVTRFLVGLAVLILLVVALLAYSVLPQTTHIVLPGENDTGEESDSSQEECCGTGEDHSRYCSAGYC